MSDVSFLKVCFLIFAGVVTGCFLEFELQLLRQYIGFLRRPNILEKKQHHSQGKGVPRKPRSLKQSAMGKVGSTGTLFVFVFFLSSFVSIGKHLSPGRCCLVLLEVLGCFGCVVNSTVWLG